MHVKQAASVSPVAKSAETSASIQTPVVTPEVTLSPEDTLTTAEKTSSPTAIALYAPTPKPVSTSAGAYRAAGTRVTPAGGSAPQVVVWEPKEPQLSQNETLTLFGYNLSGAKVQAVPAEGGDAISLNGSAKSNEELLIPASEWHKLKTGNYSVTATNNRGEHADITVSVGE
jgi:hypothetical protein